MVKQKIIQNSKKMMSRISLAGVIVLLCLVSASIPHVLADQYQDQINQLNQQNNEKKQKIGSLQVEANSLETTISSLASQINGLQSEVQANEIKRDEIQKQIEVAELELAKQKRILGENIKAMYLEGEISTLEMLASSKDLSEFVDKEQYRSSVKDKIQATLAKVTELKFQLRAQKESVERLLKEKQSLQNQISQQKNEQDRLLGLNQNERSALDNQIKENFSQISDLKRKQAIENARRFGGGSGVAGGGGYPWGGATCIHTGSASGFCPNYDWAVGGAIYNWSTGGYGYRNCTDWVAWRVMSTGRNIPSGLGHAYTWAIRSGNLGYGVSNNPSVGAAAVSENGGVPYGHVMYVEAVNGDGSVIVSDYNRLGDGLYRITSLSSGQASGLRYVQF